METRRRAKVARLQLGYVKDGRPVTEVVTLGRNDSLTLNPSSFPYTVRVAPRG